MVESTEYQGIIDFEEVTIASSGTTSGAVDTHGMTICGIYTPDTMTGTALTLTASTSLDGTYVPVEDGAGAAISKTIDGGEYVPFNPADTAGLRYIKVVSGTAEGAERTLTLALRQV